MSFFSNWMPKKKYIIITKPYIVKGKLVTVYLHSGEKYEETIKDIFYIDHRGFNHYSTMYREGIQYRFQGNSVHIKKCTDNGIVDIFIPNTSIVYSEVGTEQQFETIEIYDRMVLDDKS